MDTSKLERKHNLAVVPLVETGPVESVMKFIEPIVEDCKSGHIVRIAIVAVCRNGDVQSGWSDGSTPNSFHGLVSGVRCLDYRLQSNSV